MKKKLFMVVGLIVIIITVIVVSILLMKRNDTLSEYADLNGTWLVYQRGSDYVYDEYLVFMNGEVNDFRGDDMKLYFNSDYSYSEGVLNISKLSKYTVRRISDVYIVLTESNSLEWKLLKVSKDSLNIPNIDISDIEGFFSVARVAGEKRMEEEMEFKNGILIDTRNKEIFLTCNYTLDSPHLLFVPDLSKKYSIYKTEKGFALIDRTDNYLWELEKIY